MDLNLYPARNIITPMASEIDIAKIKSEEEDGETSLRPYEILSYPADFTLEVLVKKWNDGDIKSPEEQRNYIWKIEKASKLIESFLLNLPVPPIFLYQARQDNSLLVVDGHQRLRSIAYFFSGRFQHSNGQLEPFNLVGLHKKSPFANASFGQLQSSDPKAFNRLKDSVLRAVIMKQLHPVDDTSIVEVFSRLNTGGVALQMQEVRNCVYSGEFNQWLKELNRNEDWRNIVGKKPADNRMRDVELILRFLALYYESPYEKPMKEFLNDFMRTNRRPPPQPNEKDSVTKRNTAEAERRAFDTRMEEFSKLFTKTARAVHMFLGGKPFHIIHGLNAAVFDSVFVAFAKHIDRVDIAKASAAQISHMDTKYKQLLADVQYKTATSSATTDEGMVELRLLRASTILFS